MRIMYVCTDADIGGAERLLALLGRHAEQRDVTRLVVLLGRGTLSDELEAAFDEVVYLDTPPESRDLFRMVRGVNSHIRLFKPDVVSSHLFHADLVTALARMKVPRTTTVHTHGFGPGDHPLTKLIARAVGILSFRFDAVIPSSDSPDMVHFIRLLRMRNVRPPILNGAEIPSAPSFGEGAREFVSLARNHPVKGHDVLFGAFADMAADYPEWRLRAYGPDVLPGNERMETVIDESGARQLVDAGRISLEGPTNRPHLALTTASALIISSRYGETSPLVGAEAAGSGVPVITTNIGNCASFADDPRFVVPPGDRAALAKALRLYASLSDAERRELSNRARARAIGRYHPQRVAAEYREVFAELVEQRRA